MYSIHILIYSTTTHIFIYVHVLYIYILTSLLIHFIYIDRIYGVIFNGDFWSAVMLPLDIITL